MEKMMSVKSNALKNIREYYHVSIKDVSDKTNIKVEALQKYETGEDFPSYPQLERLADYYNKPLFFFFSNSISLESNMQAAFRSLEDQSGEFLSKPTRELLEKANMYRLNLLELFEGDHHIYFTDIIKECDSTTSLINTLREVLEFDLNVQKHFMYPEDMLEYLRDKLFDNGVYVFKDSFKNDDISGLCIYDDEFPVILLNNKMSFKRQVFTLFHEIYHIYLKEADIDPTNRNEETKCNEFASDFLIPIDDLLQQIELIDDIEDINELDDLAKKYNVSRDALMYKLVKLEYLGNDFWKRNCIGPFRNNNSSGGNFYYTKISYLGNSYLNKVFRSYYSGEISKTQVGVYTGLKTMHISKLASKMMGGAFV